MTALARRGLVSALPDGGWRLTAAGRLHRDVLPCPAYVSVPIGPLYRLLVQTRGDGPETDDHRALMLGYLRAVEDSRQVLDGARS